VSDPTASAPDGVLLPVDVYRRALAVGRRAAGSRVLTRRWAACIVRDGGHRPRARPLRSAMTHAEVVALARAGHAADGATAVVTLEPCAHHGTTPPCVDALVGADVGEVHVLLRDPDPAAAGGHRTAAGGRHHGRRRRCASADLAEQAAHDLRGFLARVRSGRPHVTLKLAQASRANGPSDGGYLTGRPHGTRAPPARGCPTPCSSVGRRSRPTTRSSTCARRDAIAPATSGRRQRIGRHRFAGASGPARHDRPRRTRCAAGPRCEALRAVGAQVVEVAHEAMGERSTSQRSAALLDHRVLTVLAEPGPCSRHALLARGSGRRRRAARRAGATAAGVRPALDALARLLDDDAAARRGRTEDGDG
jgi:pyrimidine deaminase RibD-like protein